MIGSIAAKTEIPPATNTSSSANRINLSGCKWNLFFFRFLEPEPPEGERPEEEPPEVLLEPEPPEALPEEAPPEPEPLADLPELRPEALLEAEPLADLPELRLEVLPCDEEDADAYERVCEAAAYDEPENGGRVCGASATAAADMSAANDEPETYASSSAFK